MTSPVERISGPSAGSTPGNLLNGKTGLFTKKFGTGSMPFTMPPVRCLKSCKLLTEHQADRNFGQRHAGGFTDERHGTRSARIHFEHVDFAVLDGILDVHQPDHVQGARELGRVLLDGFESLFGEIEMAGSTQELSPE